MDEGMLLVYPELLLKGRLPYRDFELITGPADPLILATAYAGFGTNIFVERSVGLVYRILIVAAVFGIAQRWSVFIATGCVLVAGILLGGTDLWANTWYAGVAFALSSLWATANIAQRGRCLAGGFLAGMACLARCDFGPGLILALLPLFLAMTQMKKLHFLVGGVLRCFPVGLADVCDRPGADSS